MKIINILCNINILLILVVAINKLFYKKAVLLKKYSRIMSKIEGSKAYKKLNSQILEYIKKIKPNSLVGPSFLFAISLVTSIVAFVLVKYIFEITSTAFIVAIIIFIFPFALINLLVKHENKKIKHILPCYILNIKNHIENSNNIILAFEDTQVQEPLRKYIYKFNLLAKKSVNTKQAFNELKNDVGIKSFSSFINAVSTCYSNGGNFEEVLNRFSQIITKENIEKERLKEASYSSIITLVIMMCINVYVMFTFVFSNIEYIEVIKNTMLGNIILNFSVITYVLIGYLIVKIYGMEE